MPGGPHQILMHYAPRRPPPPQARNLIPAALRAAARVVAPGPAWPGSVPWQPGSPGRAGPRRERPGHWLRDPRHAPGNQRRPEQTQTPGSRGWRRSPPNLPRIVARGWPGLHRSRIVARGWPGQHRSRRPSRPAGRPIRDLPANPGQGPPTNPRHPAFGRPVPCQAPGPGYRARNRSRGWPGHRQPWEYCPEKGRSPDL
jgi:hypothetical protein